MTVPELLEYEIRSSWWCGWISNKFLQTIAARYFVWKVRRKFKRYEASNKLNKKLDQLMDKHGYNP